MVIETIPGLVLPIPLPPPPPNVMAFAYFMIVISLMRMVKGFDRWIQEGSWFKEDLDEQEQKLLKMILDVLHHWPIGYVMMCAAFGQPADAMMLIATIPLPLTVAEFYWIGFSIFLDDLPDTPPRLRKMFANYTFLSRNDE